MFDDSRKKFLRFSTVCFVMECALLALYALLALGDGSLADKFTMLLVAPIGAIMCYVQFLLRRVFGEMVQETKENRLLSEKEVELLQKISEQNETLVALLAAKEGAPHDDATSGHISPSSKPKTAQTLATDSPEPPAPAAAETPPAQTEKMVWVDRSQTKVTCPYCGMVQKSDRYRCYNCAAPFVDKEP